MIGRKIILKIGDHNLESEFDSYDLNRTSTNLQNNLDKYFEDIELKEG